MHYEPGTGKWTLDRDYDGVKRTRPKGVIYLVTGAGGARLYNPEQHDDPKSWQEFTKVFVSNVHSFTVADADQQKLALRQIDTNGKEVDRFLITR
jgi:hypothetical protein